MPLAPGRACAQPGCPAIVRDGRYCEAHRVADSQYDRERGTASRRGYGARWRKLRLMVLRARPLCADPFSLHGETAVAATDVDHIVARRAGGSDAMENLQSLCHACHTRKTNDEQRGGMGGKSLEPARLETGRQ